MVVGLFIIPKKIPKISKLSYYECSHHSQLACSNPRHPTRLQSSPPITITTSVIVTSANASLLRFQTKSPPPKMPKMHQKCIKTPEISVETHILSTSSKRFVLLISPRSSRFCMSLQFAGPFGHFGHHIAIFCTAVKFTIFTFWPFLKPPNDYYAEKQVREKEGPIV